MKKLLALFFVLFTATVIAQPNIDQPDNITVFEFPFDGFADFDLTINESQMLNGIDPATVSIFYYLTLADAQTQSNPIAAPTTFSNFANPQTIYVNVIEISTNLFSTTSFDIEVSDDVVFIPDPNFLQSIINQGADTNNSGNIQSFEAQAVSDLFIISSVSDITGLEAFTNIIDLSSIGFPIYAMFDLSLLPLLESLEISGGAGPGILNLSNNPNLMELNITGSGITALDVSNNLLLEQVFIENSELTTLNFNNNPNLIVLALYLNQFLESVFIKNGSYEMSDGDLSIWIPGNNPSLQYVCADPDQVSEIQSFAGTDYVVNSFCDFTPGGDFNAITGLVQFDLNNDGCDVTDPFVPYLNIDAGPGPSTLVPAVQTDSLGVYNLYVGQAGNLTIQPNLENPSYFNISPNFPVVNIPFIDNSTTTQDFCLTANGVAADAEVVIAPIFPSQPGFDATYKLVYKNKGNQVLSGSVDFQYDDAVLDLVSTSEVPDVQNTGLLSFNFIDLDPFESRFVEITLNVNGPTETPAINIDDVLDYTSTITIDQTEETPDDNTFTYSEIVVGAYDPNDITCLQGDIVPDTEIGEFLHYMIRFENTGNAPAENVVVTTDISPSDYNINTLQILNASHNMFMRNNNGVIEFVFENIQLAAGGGHGNILLKIKTQPNLTVNDEVEAQADIYFDFNFPIETNIANTAFSLLSTEQFLDEVSMVMYPNPSDDELHIESSSSIQNVRIFDVQGKEVLTYTNAESNLNSKLDVSGLSKGVYLIQLQTLNGRVTQKLIKR